MQAASITLLTTMVNGADSAADQAAQGQDIRINAAQGLNGCDTLFNAILRQGINGEALPGAAADGMLQAGAAAAETAEGADAADQADADALDVCSLLVQLMLAGNPMAQPSGAAAPDESAAVSPDEVAAVSLDEVAAVAPNEVAAAAPGTEAAPGAEVAPDTASALSAAAGNDANGASSPGKQVLDDDTAPAVFDPEAAKPPESPTPTEKNGGHNSAAGAGGGSVFRSLTAALEMAVARDASESSASAAEDAADTGVSNAGAAPGGETADAPDKTERPADVIKPADAEPEGRDEGGAEGGLSAQTAAAPVGISAGEGGGSSGEITAAVEKALDRFARELRSFGGTARELRIVLEPESLGVLTISVVKTETGVSAKIKSENKDVAAAISENLQKLITTMESRGIRLDDVDVSYARPDQSAGFGRQGFDGGGGDGAPGGRYAPAYGRNEETDAAGDFWREYYGSTSGGDAAVDYRI